VRGNRCKLIDGLKISVGNGDCRSVGMRSWRIRIVRPSLSVRSSGGLSLLEEEEGEEGVGKGEDVSSGCDG
jgi:hypothetical protein